MKNEKPSKIANIGEDVSGAARHRNDTYDVEKERAKAEKKAADVWLKARKAELASAIENAGEDVETLKKAIVDFERSRFLHDFPAVVSASTESLPTLRNKIVELCNAKTISYDAYRTIAKAFNRLSKKIGKINHVGYYGCPSIDDLKNWVSGGGNKKQKAQFSELCGKKGDWGALGEVVAVAEEQALPKVRAIQWGNSVPDSERSAISKELARAIDSLNSLGGRIPGVLAGTAFAFAARGRKGKLAHFEPGLRVLNINRGVVGCLVHEIGHAVDRGEGVPAGVLAAYRQKVRANEFLAIQARYYLKPEEIFARAFERYVFNRLPELRPFAILDIGTWPEETPELVSWVESKFKREEG